MTDQPVRRRRLLLVGVIALVFVTGAVAGALATAAAAHRAAQVGFRAARGLFVSDQTSRMAIAWNAGDMNEALAHARCAYEAEFAEGAGWFDPKAIGWSVWGGSLLDMMVVTPNAPTAQKVRPTLEGEAQARIAVVLERLGRTDDARTRLAKAVAVGGREERWWRELGLKVVGISLPQGFRHPDGTVHP
jgi:hypothetical protein